MRLAVVFNLLGSDLSDLRWIRDALGLRHRRVHPWLPKAVGALSGRHGPSRLADGVCHGVSLLQQTPELLRLEVVQLVAQVLAYLVLCHPGLELGPFPYVGCQVQGDLRELGQDLRRDVHAVHDVHVPRRRVRVVETSIESLAGHPGGHGPGAGLGLLGDIARVELVHPTHLRCLRLTRHAGHLWGFCALGHAAHHSLLFRPLRDELS